MKNRPASGLNIAATEDLQETKESRSSVCDPSFSGSFEPVFFSRSSSSREASFCSDSSLKNLQLRVKLE